jgi:type I restriction-modification system DNA methylase subunit
MPVPGTSILIVCGWRQQIRERRRPPGGGDKGRYHRQNINTYFWIVTNRKRPERQGKVALIDARDGATKMRKSLGNKRHYLTDETTAVLTALVRRRPGLGRLASQGAHQYRVRIPARDQFP